MSELRDAALAYAQAGWAVFPIRPGTKVPLTSHGCKDATRDEPTIRRWWSNWPTANIGVATGARSGICVVDLDGDPDEARSALLERGPLPETLTQRTGSGGLHLIYRTGGHQVPNSAKRLAPGVDTRGAGGYILVPPSLHPNGERYEWLRVREVATVPDWVVTALSTPRLVDNSRRTKRLTPEAAGRLVVGALDVVSRAEPGTRNDRLNWAAYRLFGRLAAGESLNGLDLWAVREMLHDAAAEAGLPYQEAEKTLLSAARAAFSEFRV